eukprot:CAMPEP_0117015950 /NCGR_PEP_ID=MMETSP0472-20121206/12642_1 /TAXON_ID=693140 ORGANISM="Tiarina fusus, Strain LIS" /NCGR_SAMPLE_ID=MMETSP0472 /ASSEMBLY_ACC=CAM_ASM_000603 /LENGTH=337 /DNA_ID=CAMNT_0004719855 /DNA_START=77 /DNA_END=1090 /DNA_ORIENTATION=+
MSPTIALKCRMERSLHPDAATRRSKLGTAFRSVSIGSEMELPSDLCENPPYETEAVHMLLSMSTIVSKEMMTNSFIFDDDDESDKSNKSDAAEENRGCSALRTTQCSSPSHSDSELFAWSRVRTVSIDSPPTRGLPMHLDTGSMSLGIPALVSPTSTPTTRGRPLRKASLRLSHKAKKEHLKIPKMPQLQERSSVTEHKKRALEACVAKGKSMKKILRKKFSWKNYPELEAFLIANREEYLRHSALNYTVQQKQYNNRLTERLLELAAEHGYVFDEAEFSFVTVRDRIRCYFKSYVQSAKKRGVIIGYAARKAGLLTEEELERSAEQEGQIVTPPEI